MPVGRIILPLLTRHIVAQIRLHGQLHVDRIADQNAVSVIIICIGQPLRLFGVPDAFERDAVGKHPQPRSMRVKRNLRAQNHIARRVNVASLVGNGFAVICDLDVIIAISRPPGIGRHILAGLDRRICNALFVGRQLLNRLKIAARGVKHAEFDRIIRQRRTVIKRGCDGD